jgi:hypothetical protein
MGFERRAGGFEEAGLPFVVCVEKGQEFAGGQCGAGITSLSWPCIAVCPTT